MTDKIEGCHRDRSNILEFLKKKPFEITSWRTVQRWKKRGFPIRHDHTGTPFLIEVEAHAYLIKASDKIKENLKNQ